jgi:hypothetical protein
MRSSTIYGIIPAADDATVKWIAKGLAKNSLVDVSDEIQEFVQGGMAWVGNAGLSPTTCTVWAEIYAADGGQNTSGKFGAYLTAEVGRTIKWYVYGWYQTHNKYNGLFGESDVRSCVATTSTAGIESGSADVLIPRITNIPNPFGGSTQIVFDLARAAKVSVIAYGVRARAVAGVFKGVLPEGRNAVSWNGRTDSGEDLPSGIYFFRFTSDNVRVTRKAMLVR